MTTTIEPAADVEAPDSAETGIETLGHANRFAVWDSEFRYDGRIRVPAGVKISKVEYAYYGRDDKSYVTATVAPRGQMGTSEQYEIIDLTFWRTPTSSPSPCAATSTSTPPRSRTSTAAPTGSA